MPSVCSLRRMAAIGFVLFATSSTLYGQGINLTGVGAVNRSMGGAGTAAPLDATGALHWNPASISALPTNEVTFGVEMLQAEEELRFGNTIVDSEAGVSPVPSVGWVHHLNETTTIGLGLYGIGGFRLNYPALPAAIPVIGGNSLFTDAEFLQLAPTISFALSDKLSIGLSPTITMGRVTIAGMNTRQHWGMGAQVGVYYITDNNWHLGASIKSPQWFEEFRFFTAAGTVFEKIDYPMIISLGAAYSGIEDLIFAFDVRYFDYENTDGFSRGVGLLGPNGLGFENVFAMAVGVQRRISDRTYLRLGYNYNSQPFTSDDVAQNIAAPLLQRHNASVGGSYRMAENVDISLAYIHAFESDASDPTGTINSQIAAYSGAFGVTVRY